MFNCCSCQNVFPVLQTFFVTKVTSQVKAKTFCPVAESSLSNSKAVRGVKEIQGAVYIQLLGFFMPGEGRGKEPSSSLVTVDLSATSGKWVFSCRWRGGFSLFRRQCCGLRLVVLSNRSVLKLHNLFSASPEGGE